MLARVDANYEATCDDMKNGLIESYSDFCEVLQGVVNGAWIPKSEGKKDDGSKGQKKDNGISRSIDTDDMLSRGMRRCGKRLE